MAHMVYEKTYMNVTLNNCIVTLYRIILILFLLLLFYFFTISNKQRKNQSLMSQNEPRVELLHIGYFKLQSPLDFVSMKREDFRDRGKGHYFGLEQGQGRMPTLGHGP